MIALKTLRYLNISHSDLKGDNLMMVWDGERYLLWVSPDYGCALVNGCIDTHRMIK